MRLDFSVLTFCFISGFFFFQFFFISDIYFGISSGSTVTHSLRPVNLLFGLRVLLIKVLAGLRFYLVLAAEQGGEAPCTVLAVGPFINHLGSTATGLD